MAIVNPRSQLFSRALDEFLDRHDIKDFKDG
jgi:hypothetical protein